MDGSEERGEGKVGAALVDADGSEDLEGVEFGVGVVPFVGQRNGFEGVAGGAGEIIGVFAGRRARRADV